MRGCSSLAVPRTHRTLARMGDAGVLQIPRIYSYSRSRLIRTAWKSDSTLCSKSSNVCVSMGLPLPNWDREKVNLLSFMESYYERRGQLDSRSLAEEYIEHFINGTVAPGVEMEWELVQALLPQITLDEVDALASSWSEPGNTVLLVTGPEDIGPGTKDELAAAVAQQLATAHHAGSSSLRR